MGLRRKQYISFFGERSTLEGGNETLNSCYALTCVPYLNGSIVRARVKESTIIGKSYSIYAAIMTNTISGYA